MDLPLDELAPRAAEWGYQGLELACSGDHFEVQRALSEPTYVQHKIDQLARHDLTVFALANYPVGHAVSAPISPALRSSLPDYVWGDGQPHGVQQRAAEELLATFRAAQKLGVNVVSGWTGSALWPLLGTSFLTATIVDSMLEEFVARWNPLLDVANECSVQWAAEVQPGQIAFDLDSADRVFRSVGERTEWRWTLDPASLHWQGIEPAEFIRQFGSRLALVHIRDVSLNLNGRRGLLNGYLLEGDARRGWDWRSPGRGGLDWESLLRTLNAVGYEGPLIVDWHDAGMQRDFGAEEACRFVKRLDFEPVARTDGNQPFHDM